MASGSIRRLKANVVLSRRGVGERGGGGGVRAIHFYVSFKSSAVGLAATVAYGRDLSVCLGPGTFTQLSPCVLPYQCCGNGATSRGKWATVPEV